MGSVFYVWSGLDEVHPSPEGNAAQHSTFGPVWAPLFPVSPTASPKISASAQRQQWGHSAGITHAVISLLESPVFADQFVLFAEGTHLQQSRCSKTIAAGRQCCQDHSFPMHEGHFCGVVSCLCVCVCNELFESTMENCLQNPFHTPVGMLYCCMKWSWESVFVPLL